MEAEWPRDSSRRLVTDFFSFAGTCTSALCGSIAATGQARSHPPPKTERDQVLMSRCKLPLDANQISMPPSISCCRPTNSDANASIFHRRLAIDDRLHPSGVRKKIWPVSGCSCHLETGPARVAKYLGVYALGRHLSDDTNLRGRGTWHRYKCDKTLMACQNQTNAKKKQCRVIFRFLLVWMVLEWRFLAAPWCCRS